MVSRERKKERDEEREKGAKEINIERMEKQTKKKS